MHSQQPAAPRRWSRTQRYVLSPSGRTAINAYRRQISAMASLHERAGFSRACAHWATSFDLQPDDGMYLMELATQAAASIDLELALAICGQSRSKVDATLGRLLTAGFITAAAR